MFKKILHWYKALIRRHIVCWPEEYYHPYSQPSDSPVADVSLWRASAHRVFNHAKPGDVYMLVYESDLLRDRIIEELLSDGWTMMEENVYTSRERVYVFYLNRKPSLSRF